MRSLIMCYLLSIGLFVLELFLLPVAGAYQSPPPALLRFPIAGQDAPRVSPVSEQIFGHPDWPDPVAIILKPGMAFLVALEQPVSSATAHVGDGVRAQLFTTVYYQNRVLFTPDARLEGTISYLEPAKAGANAVMAVQFHQLSTVQGQWPIKAYVRTGRPDHAWGGELTLGTVPLQVMHNVGGIGSYNQTVLGGPRAMGQPVTLKPGEVVTVVLENRLCLPVAMLPNVED